MSCTGEMEVVVNCGTAHRYVCRKFLIILQNRNSDKNFIHENGERDVQYSNL